MQLISKFREYLNRQKIYPVTTEPGDAYNLWSEQYDEQPDNLMLQLDEEIFSRLIADIPLKDIVIADVGCGTGRHWQHLFENRPRKIIGFDVSQGMLNRLQQKFPGSETFRMHDHRLFQQDNNSCELIISTLTMAHIPEIDIALEEWYRILKPGGNIIITDYHPAALEKGGNRTFRYHNEIIYVKNYVHPIERIIQIAKQLGLELVHYAEKKIDDATKPYYQKQQSLDLFEKFKGVPIIYGLHLRKSYAAA